MRRHAAKAKAVTYDAGDAIGFWVMTLGVIIGAAMALAI